MSAVGRRSRVFTSWPVLLRYGLQVVVLVAVPGRMLWSRKASLGTTSSASCRGPRRARSNGSTRPSPPCCGRTGSRAPVERAQGGHAAAGHAGRGLGGARRSGEPEARYDEAVGLRRSGGGLGQHGTGIESDRLAPADPGFLGELPGVAEVGGLLAALTGGLVRKPRPARPVAVPGRPGAVLPRVRGGGAAAPAAGQAVRLTERPMAVDGLVVDQDPPPGTVRRGGQLTVQIWHPAAR